MVYKSNRRDFLKNGLVLSGASFIASPLSSSGEDDSKNPGGENYTFLFQGDSITDGNRTRNNDWNHVMGHGYAYIIASKLWYDFPEKKFHFFNRGISGNKITDLEQRWDTDTIALKPDVLSILIGVNDLDALIDENDAKFTTAYFEEGYRTVLQKTKKELPLVQLVLCEPFILPVGRIKDKWKAYNTEIKKRQELVKGLAKEFNAIYIPLQDAFDSALKKAPADYWIWDGIHPMPAGHELMALQWMKEAGRELKFIR